MQLQRMLLLLSGLVAFVFADVEPDEIPKQCKQVCDAVVQRSAKCDKNTDDDHAEKECMCKLDNASTVVPQCEACVAKFHSEVSDHSDPHDNDVYDIIEDCSFTTTTYDGGSSATTGPTASTPATSAGSQKTTPSGTIDTNTDGQSQPQPTNTDKGPHTPKPRPHTTWVTVTETVTGTEGCTAKYPPTTTETPTSPPTSTGCPANLSGNYEYPHLIVPIDSSNPDTAEGTSYSGTISSTVSSIFNFDIPHSDSGKTCSLIFLFPNQSDLETSSFTFSGDGKVDVAELKAPATAETTYNNAPGVMNDFGTVTIAPGNSYLIATFDCPAGERVGFEVSNAGSTDLNFFQDYNPSPIGMYITTC